MTTAEIELALNEWQPIVLAAFDLAGRTGAKQAEIGWINDDPPHLWYMSCLYQGDRLIVDECETPAQAAAQFAERILAGGHCQHCHRRTTTDTAVALGTEPQLDNTRPVNVPAPKLDRAARRRMNRASIKPDSGELCIWHLKSAKWIRGCDPNNQPESKT